MSETNDTAEWSGLEIAIIGMAGRFPGAANIGEFWQNLSGGVESITFFTDEEAIAAGADPSHVAAPNYVKAGALLEGIELFDASFFGYSHREAELIDPQQRIFLECAHEALEHSGYGADERGGRVGVYAGAGLNTYLLNLAASRSLIEAFGAIQVLIANDKDFLATRVSYKLNLEGPSMSVQTACSTSLVAVHMACRSLLGGDCDMALAGGVAVNGYMRGGYLYQEGGILSPDGHCRAFDAKAKGTVFGSGVGIVVLKRLEEAIADGDTIHAVIKGSSINNDGASKIGYTAPRAEGQAQVVSAAQLMAEVAPETVSYIEAHGTGTELGDPIELDALTQVFAATTERKNFCALGSLKTNIGHLDAAAGVSGLIKTVLALKHRVMPPSLNFESPNPQINIADSPFYVNSRRAAWGRGATPRRAGVSSFGIGGTNAHVVLEEAPPTDAMNAAAARSRQLLVLSARSRSALETTTANLAAHLRQNPEIDLADVAYTLQAGRTAHGLRRTLVCDDVAEAASALENATTTTSSAPAVFTSKGEAQARPVVFMFPGQGTQYANMGRELYRDEQTFRDAIDLCAELLRPHLGLDLREALYETDLDPEAAAHRLRQTSLTQPALFAVEYALARLWMSWGVKPASMIGHSVGEYVAACLAGVFSLDDALMLIAARGRLIQNLPAGAMLAVPLPEARITELLGAGGLSLAAVNTPSLCVVSGATDEIEALRSRLKAEGMETSLLHTSHAFHSRMMQPALAPFIERLGAAKLNAPSIPYVSNVTGTWITAAEATDPDYWARHLRRAVRFSDGVATLTKDAACVLVEVGPGRTLGALVRQHRDEAASQVLLTSLPRAAEQRSDSEQMLSALGQLWASGGRVNWSGFHAGATRRRVPLPTYPFERQRYWIEPHREANATTAAVLSQTDAVRAAATPHAALHARPELQTSFVAPQGEVETRVAAIWQDLLGTDQIGADDNFFDLGGHSLLATGVVSRLREEFQVELSLRELFARPTVGGVAETLTAVRKQDETHARGREESIPRREERGAFPLSFAQQRLWFLDQLTPGDVQHNMPISVRLGGALDVPVLERALNEVVRRHESLRTTFAVVESEPMQIVAPSLTLRLPLVDLREMPREARSLEALRLTAEEQRQAFDLSTGPLVRASLLRLEEDEHTLLLTLHHIVSDAWSFAVFTRELSALYRAFAAAEPSPLAALPIQYADFAAWQRRHLTGDVLGEQLAHWKDRLAGAPPLLALPADRPRPAVQSHDGASLSFELPQRIADGLQELSRREGATLFMTMLAAFQTLLHRYAGQTDIVVGADIANRNRRELEGLIGFFVNMLVLRTDMTGDPTFLKLLERVREMTLGAYAHQDVPFDKLVEELQPARNPSYSPLFQVVFNFYQDPAEGIDLGTGLDVAVLDSYQNVSKFDLSLFVGQRSDGIRGFWSYSTALFDAARIERLQAMFVTLLESILAKPETRLGALELTSEAERREQLKAGRELKAAGFKKFKTLKPRVVGVAPESLVRSERLHAESALPLVVRPVSDEVELASWAESNREFIETNLLRHGGLLFRGFRVASVDDFDRLARAVSPALLDYNEPSSPRSEVGRKIYTSTEYPASQWIQLHNEMSYTRHWPHKVFFCCVQPAERGGATPIASSREVFELLDASLRERFIERRVMYVRNFSPGLDLSWQHVFGTDSKLDVEDYCRRAGIAFEWTGRDRLRTTQVQQSVLRHPTTGEVVWFNQAHAFHASSLEPAVREALRAEMSEADFPRNAYYGDGSPIEDSIIEEIREAYRRATNTFEWQQGDVLMLENMLVAHGRAPFSGARKVLVAMSELIHEADVDTLRDGEAELALAKV